MLQRIKDTKLRGWAMIADSPLDVAKHCAAECPKNDKITLAGEGWIGLDIGSWADMPKMVSQPWPLGMAKVNAMMDELKQQLPMPKSVRRRNRWDENDGEVDCNRAMDGEAEYMRRAVRTNTAGPRNVALLCQVGGAGMFTADQMFWRGAATAALTDLIEAAGYSCEVWIWNRAVGTFTAKTTPDSFFCCKVKACGDPLDVGSIVNCTSAWFYRGIVMRAKMTCSNFRTGMGYTNPHRVGWDKYMDVTEGIQKIEMVNAFTRETAISTAKTMLENITKGQEARI